MTTISFSKRLWPKQRSETQNDGLGTVIRTLTLVGEGADPVVIQKDGVPVKGAIDSGSRVLVKLLVACWWSGPTTDKGRGYLESVALNGDLYRKLVEAAEARGLTHVEVVWEKSRLYAELAQLLEWAVKSLAVVESTNWRWPALAAGPMPPPEPEEEEEVEIALL